MHAEIEFDGGARPNPGPAAIGYVVRTEEGEETHSEHIGESTSNRAEYRALVGALERAKELGCTRVSVEGDSQLVVRQVTGEYGVNSDAIRPLHAEVEALAAEFEAFAIEHVGRDDNRQADALVDAAFDGD
jgi:ribonuclease HI